MENGKILSVYQKERKAIEKRISSLKIKLLSYNDYYNQTDEYGEDRALFYAKRNLNATIMNAKIARDKAESKSKTKKQRVDAEIQKLKDQEYDKISKLEQKINDLREQIAQTRQQYRHRIEDQELTNTNYDKELESAIELIDDNETEKCNYTRGVIEERLKLLSANRKKTRAEIQIEMEIKELEEQLTKTNKSITTFINSNTYEAWACYNAHDKHYPGHSKCEGNFITSYECPKSRLCKYCQTTEPTKYYNAEKRAYMWKCFETPTENAITNHTIKTITNFDDTDIHTTDSLRQMEQQIEEYKLLQSRKQKLAERRQNEAYDKAFQDYKTNIEEMRKKITALLDQEYYEKDTKKKETIKKARQLAEEEKQYCRAPRKDDYTIDPDDIDDDDVDLLDY